MSHFGRSGPPDITDTYSLLVLNITFRTSADDLFPLFDKYGKVVDIFIPRDRRTGESRGFAFVRYKYADEAHKAVERLDGRVVDGREITVQFAKYGPNAERIHKGRITETLPKSRHRSRSRSPRRRYRDDYRDRDYRRRSRSRSWDRYERDRYRHGRDRYLHRRSRSPSASPDYYRSRGRGRYDDDDDDYDDYDRRRRSRSRSHSFDSLTPQRSLSPLSRSRSVSPYGHGRDGRSPNSQSVSPRGRPADSRSPSPRHSDDD
ncbi:serine/arginine-rich splicing factor SC35-like isoform X2 [Rosa rugosa]|uniref:serine/arginine-rich splicing factor SC35-like isoform X2 n=1 Tax=Rosa rugosa TaxID=74645 RepID=UPI002B403586|nr:serine/arginine-rich splicing factor SC35-like isoform X2 [Rosa rugosa]